MRVEDQASHLTFIDRDSKAAASFFFFFFPFTQWYMAGVEWVLSIKISVLPVCPFLSSLARESRISLRFFCLFVAIGISGLWISPVPTLRYLRGKKKAREFITVGCSSIPMVPFVSFFFSLPFRVFLHLFYVSCSGFCI